MPQKLPQLRNERVLARLWSVAIIPAWQLPAVSDKLGIPVYMVEDQHSISVYSRYAKASGPGERRS